MKQATAVFKDPDTCKAAIIALAAQRKQTGNRTLFFGNGTILTDSRPQYNNNWFTIDKSIKQPTKLPDGSDIECYYLSFTPPTKDQLDEQANALANGVDPNLIKGKLIDLTFAKKGHAIMLVTNANRTNPNGGPSYRVVSLATGIVIALTFNKSLGIDTAWLKKQAVTLTKNHKPANYSPILPLPGLIQPTNPDDDPTIIPAIASQPTICTINKTKYKLSNSLKIITT